MSGRCTLLEYEDILVNTDKIDIEDGVLNRLAELNDKFADPETGAKKQFISITKHADGLHIKAKNWVGMVKIGDFTLEILPKITQKNGNGELPDEEREKIVKNLVKMLQIAWDIPIRDVEIASQKAEINSVLEIVLALYSTKLLDVVKDGLYKEYVQIEEERKYVKGQIRFEEYSKRWERRHIIPIRYNDRTADNLLNRTLKYAAYLGSIYSENNENFRRLRNIVNMVDDVSLAPVSASEIKSIHFNRLNESFKPLVNMAWLIISNLSPEYLHGKRDVFAFLIPMERVFESFIANTLLKYKSEIFGNAKVSIFVQGRDMKTRYLLTDNNNQKFFKLVPDILIKVDNKIYIVDTKYKLLNEEDRKMGVSQSDAYQMLAYAIAYNAHKIMLLYPDTFTVNENNLKSFPIIWGFVGDGKSCASDKELLIGAVDITTKINLADDNVFKNEFLGMLEKLMKCLVYQCSEENKNFQMD